MKRKLNEKQTRFIDEYRIDLNATAAYKRAGYKGSDGAARVSAHRMLEKPWIQEILQARMKQDSEELKINTRYVLMTIKDTIEHCKAKAEDGEKLDASAVLKGAELLGKHLKMFTDKLEHSGEVSVEIIRFGKNTPAE